VKPWVRVQKQSESRLTASGWVVQSKDAVITTAAPTGRKKLAQGKERSDAALGHDSQNTSRPVRAKGSDWGEAKLGEILPLKYGKARGPQFGCPRDAAVLVLVPVCART